MGTLVQKLRAGEQFFARGRVHRRKAHPIRDVGFLLFLFSDVLWTRVAGEGSTEANLYLLPLGADANESLTVYPALQAATTPQSAYSVVSALYRKEPLCSAKTIDFTCIFYRLTAISILLMAVSLSGLGRFFSLPVHKIPGQICQYIHNGDDCGHNAKSQNKEGRYKT